MITIQNNGWPWTLSDPPASASLLGWWEFASSGNLMYMESYNVFLLCLADSRSIMSSGFSGVIMHGNLTPFIGGAVVVRTVICLIVCWWTFALFSPLSHLWKCCPEHVLVWIPTFTVFFLTGLGMDPRAFTLNYTPPPALFNFSFWGRVLWNHQIAQAGLELGIHLPQPPRLHFLKACTSPGSIFHFF